MSNPLVYLAGPIVNQTFDQASDWRNEAAERFAAQGIRSLNPMRSKGHLADVPVIGHSDGVYEPYLSRHQDILARDISDVRRADVVLVNLLPAPVDNRSVGTIMEVAVAFELQKPMVCAIQPDHHLLQHPMFQEATRPFRTDDFEKALDAIVWILGGFDWTIG